MASWVDAARLRAAHRPVDVRNRQLAADLQMTDLCLFADAPWLRHRAVGDRFGSVQDGPGAFDYSRGGAVIGPSETRLDRDETVAQPTARPR